MTKYLLQNIAAKNALTVIDSFLGFFFKPQKNPPSPPKKLLLCNGAHLGDCILTTSLLPALKKTYPDLKIGMLVGSWSKAVVENHPLVDQIHTCDHWKLNRSPLSLTKKLASYRKSKAKALLEIVDYDTAIDCNFHFPNFAHLLFKAKIPTRIGFTSAGFGPFLTHPKPWTFSKESVVTSFATLLPPHDSTFLKPTLPKRATSPYKDYIVVHMGSGSPLKDWPLNKWKELCQKLEKKIIFTGRGKKESEAIAYVAGELPQAINLCDQLDFNAFVAVIAEADLLISVDTSAGHIAAAFDVPSVLIYPGIHPPTLWAPFSPYATIVTSQLKCIQQIDVETVYKRVISKLQS